MAVLKAPEVEPEGEEPDLPEELAGLDLTPYIERIPLAEQDILHMRYVLRKKESDIGAIMGLTQAAICYRIERAFQRIRILVRYPVFTAEELAEGGAMEAMLVRVLASSSARFPRRVLLKRAHIVAWVVAHMNQSACPHGSQSTARDSVVRALRILEGMPERDELQERVRLACSMLLREKCWNTLLEMTTWLATPTGRKRLSDAHKALWVTRRANGTTKRVRKS